MKKTKKIVFTTCLVGLTVIALIALLCFSPQVIAPAYADSAEIWYCNGTYSHTATQTVQFATATVTNSNIGASFPAYYNSNNSLSNACAAVAGSIIVGYYDRYCDVIPGFIPGSARGNRYTYYPMVSCTNAVQGVIDALYLSMQINLSGTGTTKTQYDNGLVSYVESQGYSVTFGDVMSGSSLDMSDVIAAISAGKPISLFLSGFNITTIIEGSASNTYQIKYYTGNHIMIAYGYKTIDYYGANGALIGSDVFLNVSSAMRDVVSGYYYVGTIGTTLNGAESCYIY